MKLTALALSLTTIAVAAVAVFAEQDKGGQPAMPPAIKPNEHHKVLEQKVGTWDCTVDVPSMSPTPSKAVYTARMDCGGLWLIGDYKGDFMGAPFVGHEVEGYSSEKSKFVATWVDSMIDHVMSLEGDYDAKTKTLSMWTDSKDMSGKPIKERHDTKFVDADTWIFSINQPGADGKYAPMMTITYKRKK